MRVHRDRVEHFDNLAQSTGQLFQLAENQSFREIELALVCLFFQLSLGGAVGRLIGVVQTKTAVELFKYRLHRLCPHCFLAVVCDVRLASDYHLIGNLDEMRSP